MNGRRPGRSGGARPTEEPLDPYQVLGVKRTATQGEIRAAYVDLMTKYHPDKVTHLGQEFQIIAKAKAQAINRAYQMLTRK